jgi:putative spermidine/putrescine transport system ATP-binding protein
VGGLVLSCNATTAGPATLALRPERIILGSAQNGGMDNHLPGVVEFVSYLGATVDVHVRISPKERVLAQLPNRADGSISKVGDNVHVAWPAGDGIVFVGRAS